MGIRRADRWKARRRWLEWEGRAPPPPGERRMGGTHALGRASEQGSQQPRPRPPPRSHPTGGRAAPARGVTMVPGGHVGALGSSPLRAAEGRGRGGRAGERGGGGGSGRSPRCCQPSSRRARSAAAAAPRRRARRASRAAGPTAPRLQPGAPPAPPALARRPQGRRPVRGRGRGKGGAQAPAAREAG